MDIEITPQFLIDHGFEARPETSWFGNGYDYQKPPEEGGSRTTQMDYTVNFGDADFIVRFTEYEHPDGKDFSTSFHIGDWYPKIEDQLPTHKTTVEYLRMAYKLVSGKSFQLVSEFNPSPQRS